MCAGAVEGAQHLLGFQMDVVIGRIQPSGSGQIRPETTHGFPREAVELGTAEPGVLAGFGKKPSGAQRDVEDGTPGSGRADSSEFIDRRPCRVRFLTQCLPHRRSRRDERPQGLDEHFGSLTRRRFLDLEVVHRAIAEFPKVRYGIGGQPAAEDTTCDIAPRLTCIERSALAATIRGWR